MSTETDTNISVGLIGYGRLAKHLAPAFRDAGIKINQWYIRNITCQEVIQDQFGLLPVNNLSLIDDRSDIILIMISDHAISNVASQLRVKNTIVCHTSGMSALDILPFRNTGVFYPLNTFNGIDPRWDRDTPLFIQASNQQTLNTLRLLGAMLCDYVRHIERTDLQTIHLAAVISQNFSNHLIAQAEHILLKNGIERSVIQPLLKSMLRNLSTSPAVLNQTGPAARKDADTIEHQVSLLEDNDQLRSIYQAITRSIQSDQLN